jgi:hypothetical protein
LHIDFHALWQSTIILWQSTINILNSGFFTALVGSGIAAFAGTWGAQRIIAGGKEREELLTEIRNANAATVVALAICNSFISIKQQHVKRMKESFDAQRNDYLERAQKFRSGILDLATPPSYVLFNLQTLILPSFPLVDILRSQIFATLSLDNRRPLMLMNALIETVDGLNTSVTNRNRLINAWRTDNLSSEDILPLYFGLANSSTRIVNQEYPALMDAIYQHTDDGIFYSKALCDDLYQHNVRLSNRFRRRFRKAAPGTIDKPDFTISQDAGLMPSDANYQDWFSLVRKAASQRKSKWAAFWGTWHRLKRRNKGPS